MLRTISKIFSLFFFVGFKINAQPIILQTEYEDPPNACYENCTPWMKELLFNYENLSQLVVLEPGVFSGECHHLSSSYDPDHTHYSVVMLDRKPSTNEIYFSTQFLFFGETNEFADWGLEKSRSEMSDYWKIHGELLRGKLGTRVEINYDDGNPAYIYWMRQSPLNGDLFYITYAGAEMKSFCHLHKNIKSINAY